MKGEGPNIYSNKLKADVIVSERGLKNDVSHHLGETKAATFEAIPYVIKNGMTVSKTTDSNGKVRSIIVAGKVYLNDKNGKNGKPVNVYCLLKADDAGQNRFYLHEVSDGKGNLYYQLSNAEKDAPSALHDSTPQKQGSAEETSSAQSVPQTEAESKPKNSDVITSIVNEVNESINEAIEEQKARGNKRFDSEGVRQSDIFYKLQDAFKNGKITADETFNAMKKYAPDVLATYGYKSGEDMVKKDKEAAERVKAEKKAKEEKLANRGPITLNQIIDMAWARAREKAQNNYQLFGRGTGEPGWNYFCNAVGGLYAEGEITAEEHNAAIKAVTGDWGDDFLFKDISTESKPSAQGKGDPNERESDWDFLTTNEAKQIEAQEQRQRDYWDQRFGEDVEQSPENTNNDDNSEQLSSGAGEASGSVSESKSESISESIPETTKEQRPVPSGTVTEHSEGELKKRTQVKGAKAEHEERMADIAKKFGTDDGTFLSYTRDEVSRIAKYCIDKYGMQEEWNRLMGEKNWSRVDFSEAGKIVYEMTMQLNRDMTNGDSGLGPVLERKPGESNKEYFERQKQSDKDAYLARREPIDALLQMYAEQKSEAGQKLQEQHKFTIADEIRMRASQRFLNYTEDGEVNNASDLAKNAKMWNIIDDLLTRAEKADTEGSKNAMMDVTRLVSRIRGRETMWGKLGLKAERSMLNDLYNKGFDPDAMASLMYGSISKIIDDLTPMTYADVIQTVRMNNMLSAPATALNNFFNNANALRVGSLAQNAAYPFAKVFEAITGKKVAFSDKSFFRLDSKVFSKETRSQSKLSAERMAFEYALLSAYYGMDGERGRFDPKNSNTNFWLNGTGVSGFAGRALARYNFLVNALVLSPDAPAKARANLGMQQGIEKAFEGVEMTPEMARNKKELEAYAEVETKRRALQDDNGATRAVLWMKNQINKAHTPGGKTVVGGRQLGELRLGDFAIAFAKVPTNVGIQRAMATPYGAAPVWRGFPSCPVCLWPC